MTQQTSDDVPVGSVAGDKLARRLLQTLRLGVAILLAGTVVDQRWHATHEEFEKASDQLRAHWLLWIGALAVLVVSALAMVRPERGSRNYGYATILASGIGYAIVSVWHFIEHANGTDPDVAHVLLVITWAGMLGGALAATVVARRVGGTRPGASDTGGRLGR